MGALPFRIFPFREVADTLTLKPESSRNRNYIEQFKVEGTLRMNAEEVLHQARQADVRLVRFLYCDNGGIVRGKATYASKLHTRIHEGIKNKIDPGTPQEIDPGNYSDEERLKQGIRRLPTSLDEALDELERDAVLTEALGSLLSTSYIAVNRNESVFFKDKTPEEEAHQHFYK